MAYTMKGIFFYICLLCIITRNTVLNFNFNTELSKKNYLILKKSYFDCRNYNVINKDKIPIDVNHGEKLCDEDQFCNYFLINALKKELRLCYDKKFIIKRPIINESWVTAIKEKLLNKYAPSIVNTQGICNHSVEKYFFDTLNEAIKKGKEQMHNYMILNFQAIEKEGPKLEAYFCETIDYFVDREGYSVFDFKKIDNPHQSCLRTKKCGMRGSIQPDDSKYEENINPGDVIEATKF
ncbi:conserved Plasmodium protein, unknown function [Plasmodium vinckei vinckei]|uniref:Uncharacterized protein n=1 Tax=Plasmodium vinckei vinckei TaxID=54757 RepID=A0A449BX97_PLAVN|nr:conserved Plasmodium protein, unknown function [Plasmodium vinckei vinckei]VEV58043.1 conserved Plasmodium protein, unknown function [Plasmodium vinckei vinckei]